MSIKDLAPDKGESAVRTYFKILLFTSLTVIISIIISSIIQVIANVAEKSTIVPIITVMIGVLVSTAIGIIFPIIYCKGLKNKLLTIFLLPTNYLIPVFAIVAYRVITAAIGIITDFPADSFG